MGSDEARRRGGSFTLVLAALALPATAGVTVFFLPVADCPGCWEYHAFSGSVNCHACEDRGRVTPFTAWRLGRALRHEEEFAPSYLPSKPPF